MKVLVSMCPTRLVQLLLFSIKWYYICHLLPLRETILSLQQIEAVKVFNIDDVILHYSI